jgi:hypothetical protein
MQLFEKTFLSLGEAAAAAWCILSIHKHPGYRMLGIKWLFKRLNHTRWYKHVQTHHHFYGASWGNSQVMGNSSFAMFANVCHSFRMWRLWRLGQLIAEGYTVILMGVSIQWIVIPSGYLT